MSDIRKIYVAGHKGLVGSAIVRRLENAGYNALIVRDRSELNLLDQKAVFEFLSTERPDYIFMAAAKVGGIAANDTYRAQFIYENLQIEANLIHGSYLAGVKDLLFLGSSCIYPKYAPQPMSEECLLTGELEYTNEPYAIAKISGIKLCESYNLQYGMNFLSVMPTNLYGPKDNFDFATSHVLPALLRKFHLGKCLMDGESDSVRYDLDKNPIDGVDGSAPWEKILDVLDKYGITLSSPGNYQVTIWGTGSPRREFLHSDDLADACVYIMENLCFRDMFQSGKVQVRNTHINIGTGEDISIRELVILIQDIVGFRGQVCFDDSKPDGTPRKLLDVSKLESLGWKYTISLQEGVSKVYNEYSL
ncbi:MAG: GDP-L-fucose synthase [Chlorobium sp.]|uniref:GDP-L-fucose synthase family protein n=1 Tax=Chlorobium sp. TaxID=1095 RepID=UPI0025BBFC3D|nr:GDP-L-fucose synthase [Chlorobium sp.]MCF8383436.1 GDP-L-fucose synthase [Chlorobium sp.]